MKKSVCFVFLVMFLSCFVSADLEAICTGLKLGGAECVDKIFADPGTYLDQFSMSELSDELLEQFSNDILNSPDLLGKWNQDILGGKFELRNILSSGDASVSFDSKGVLTHGDSSFNLKSFPENSVVLITDDGVSLAPKVQESLDLGSSSDLSSFFGSDKKGLVSLGTGNYILDGDEFRIVYGDVFIDPSGNFYMSGVDLDCLVEVGDYSVYLSQGNQDLYLSFGKEAYASNSVSFLDDGKFVAKTSANGIYSVREGTTVFNFDGKGIDGLRHVVTPNDAVDLSKFGNEDLSYDLTKKTETEELQKFLKNNGYDIGSAGVDGKFGPKTQEALKEFQKSVGVEQTGVLDDSTKAKISKLYSDGSYFVQTNGENVHLGVDVDAGKYYTLVESGGKNVLTIDSDKMISVDEGIDFNSVNTGNQGIGTVARTRGVIVGGNNGKYIKPPKDVIESYNQLKKSYISSGKDTTNFLSKMGINPGDEGYEQTYKVVDQSWDEGTSEKKYFGAHCTDFVNNFGGRIKSKENYIYYADGWAGNTASKVVSTKDAVKLSSMTSSDLIGKHVVIQNQFEETPAISNFSPGSGYHSVIPIGYIGNNWYITYSQPSSTIGGRIGKHYIDLGVREETKNAIGKIILIKKFVKQD